MHGQLSSLGGFRLSLLKIFLSSLSTGQEPLVFVHLIQIFLQYRLALLLQHTVNWCDYDVLREMSYGRRRHVTIIGLNLGIALVLVQGLLGELLAAASRVHHSHVPCGADLAAF